MNSIYLTKDNLDKIRTFVDKYPSAETFELQSDSSSGIGTILHVSVNVLSDGDWVQIRKTIVDESGW
jgi:hypothetical protein